MGRQVNFYAVHDDFAAVMQFAASRKFRILPARYDSQRYDEIGFVEPIPIASFEWKSVERFYFIPEGASPVDVFYHDTRDPKIVYLAAHVSPVIQCIVSTVDSDNRCQSGRIYMNAPKWLPVSKSADLNYPAVLKGFNQLARVIRKWNRLERHRRYIGAKTESLVEDGELLLG